MVHDVEDIERTWVTPEPAYRRKLGRVGAIMNAAQLLLGSFQGTHDAKFEAFADLDKTVGLEMRSNRLNGETSVPDLGPWCFSLDTKSQDLKDKLGDQWANVAWRVKLPQLAGRRGLISSL
jgi:hypothetical protein